MDAPQIVDSERLFLRRLQKTDAQPYYLSWLNDPEVQSFTRRRGRTTSMQDLENFLKAASTGTDYHLAICLKDGTKHIGNISLNSIDLKNQSAEISIMLGDRGAWGKGFGAEAVRALTQFAFENLKLHRLWAESANPSFNALIKKCGWVQEGKRREALLVDGQFYDYLCWSLLKSEWRQGQ